MKTTHFIMERIKTGIILMLLVIINIGCTTSDNQSETYYISPKGNDDNPGLSMKTAWASIEKVNSVIFQPGNAILFESGGVWKGQLRPQGNGESGKPITISSYGKGSMPVINIGEAEGAAIQLVNQSWWEIQGIEITSGAQPKPGIGRQGIVALVKGEGKHVRHIVIRDCYIHDMWGQLGGNTDYTGYRSAAILVGYGWKPTNCTANDILIENNTIKRFDKVGIRISGDSSIIVRRNYFENLGGDGIIVGGTYKGLIEYNVAKRTCLRTGDPDLDTEGEKWWPHTAAIWLWNCTETVMQFNEVYNTGRQLGNNDGMAYDFDFDCKNCILQYNYSAYNQGGFLLIMPRTFENIVRYNISVNDQRHLLRARGHVEDRNLIHNNIFYLDHSTVIVDYHHKRERTKDSIKLGATFKNNIFYVTGQGRFQSDGCLFYRNCYFGPWLNGLPDDPEKLLADPMFVAPGTGGIGLSTLGGYKLQAESPCINTGVFIEMDSKRDFYGNPINDGATDIGAYEQEALK